MPLIPSVPSTEASPLGVQILPLSDQTLQLDFYLMQEGKPIGSPLSSFEMHNKTGAIQEKAQDTQQHSAVTHQLQATIFAADQAISAVKVGLSLDAPKALKAGGLVLHGAVLGFEVNEVLASKKPVEAATELATHVAGSVVGARVGMVVVAPAALAFPEYAPVILAGGAAVGGPVGGAVGDFLSFISTELSAKKDPMACLQLQQSPVTHPPKGEYLASLTKSCARSFSSSVSHASATAAAHRSAAVALNSLAQTRLALSNTQRHASATNLMQTRMQQYGMNPFAESSRYQLKLPTYQPSQSVRSKFHNPWDDFHKAREPVVREKEIRRAIDTAIFFQMSGMVRPSAFSAWLMAKSLVGSGIDISYSQFSQVARSTFLVSSYNSFNTSLRLREVLAFFKDIGGVASQVSVIEDLIDSEAHAKADEYLICFPDTHIDSALGGLCKQVARELFDAYFTHKTSPFFSLHFNNDGYMYPVIHPAYQNTLTGQIISILDYWMKGFLNGGIFDAEFIKRWHTLANCDESALRAHLIDLKKYCSEKCPDVTYVSLREMMMRYGIDQSEVGVSNDYQQPFMTSFRIIAYQEKVERYGNIFIPHPTFRVEYSIDLMPDYELFLKRYVEQHGQYPDDYQKIRHCYEQAAIEIKEKFPKLPFCKDFFQLLGVINFYSYMYATLEKMGKIPDLAPEPPIEHFQVPKAFPPIPVRYYRTVDLQISLADVLTRLQSILGEPALDRELSALFNIKRLFKLSPSLQLTQFPLVVISLLRERLPDIEYTPAETKKIIDKSARVLLAYIKNYRVDINNYCHGIIAQFPLSEQAAYKKLSPNDLVQKTKLGIVRQLASATERWTLSPALAKDEIFNEIPKEDPDSQQAYDVIRADFQQIDELKVRETQALEDALAEAGVGATNTGAVAEAIAEARANISIRANERYRASATSIFTQICNNNTRGLEQKLETIDHFSALLLQQPSLATYEVGTTYVYPLMGFTSDDAIKESGEKFRIVGGCGMSLPNLRTVPIEDAEAFADLVATHISDTPETYCELMWKGVSYSVMRMPVKPTPDLKLTDTSFLQPAKQILETTIETGEVPAAISTVILNQDMDKSGSKLIHYAAQTLPGESFLKLTEQSPAQVQAVDALGHYPMHAAVHSGNDSVVAMLLKIAPLQRDVLSHAGMSPLMLAVQQGRTNIVKMLLLAGANCNQRLPNGLFPLYIAIQNNYHEVALLLLEQADLVVNEKLDSDMTPLHLAIDLQMTDVAKRLIEKGARGDIKRKSDGYMALHSAAEQNQFEVLKDIVTSGVSPTLTVGSIKTAVHIAAEKGHLLIVTYLIDQSPDSVYGMDDTIDSPLIIAIKSRHLNVAKYLAESAPLDVVDQLGQTASMTALQYGMPVIADILIRRGARIDIRDREGYDYLYYLIRNGEFARFERILAQYPERNLIEQSYHEKNLLDIALQFKQTHFVYFLKDTVRAIDHVHALARYYASVDEVIALQESFSSGSVNQNANGPLLANIAASNGSPRCLSFLLSSLTHRQIESSTLLIDAISSGDIATLQLVLSKWPDIQKPLDEQGNTALHLAVSRGSRAMVELLLQSGSDVRITNNSGQTGFHIAAVRADAYILKRLFKLTRPNDWPKDLLLSDCNLDSAVLGLLKKYAVRLPKTTDTALSSAVDSAEFYMQELPEDELKELQELLDNHAFEDAANLIDENPVLINAFKTAKGGELLQALFKGIEDSSSLVAALGENQAMLASLLPDGLLTKLSEANVNPAQFLGRQNLLRTVLAASDDNDACYRLRLLGIYFKEALPILAQDPVENGRTFPRLALAYNKENLFMQLQEICQSIASASPSDFSPLHEVVMLEKYNLVKQLLESYPANVFNHKKQTPLMLAAVSGNRRIIELLLSHGANPEQSDLEGMNALHYALKGQEEQAALALLPLMRNGNESDRRGITPLFLASSQGFLSVVRYLCEHGNYKQAFDDWGRDALHHAASKNQVKVIEYLVSKGFPINQPEHPTSPSKLRSCKKRTPLHLAAGLGHSEAVATLLNLGADPDVGDAWDRTVYEYAVMSKESPMLRIVEQLSQYHTNEHKTKRLFAAAQSNHLETLDELILEGADINVTNKDGNTLIHICATYNSTDVLKRLLLGGNCLLDLANGMGCTALQRAAYYGHVTIIEYLIAAQVDINQTDTEQKTALFVAAEEGHLGAVSALLKGRVDFTLKHVQGLTPLQAALFAGHIEIACTLAGAGDTSWKEIHGLLPNQQTKIQLVLPQFKESYEALSKAPRYGQLMAHHGLYQLSGPVSGGVPYVVQSVP